MKRGILILSSGSDWLFSAYPALHLLRALCGFCIFQQPKLQRTQRYSPQRPRRRKLTCYLILSIVFAASSSGFSQNAKGAAKKYVRDADNELYNNNFFQALELYQKAYRLDTGNVQVTYKMATCMYGMKKYKNASLPYFEKAVKGGITDANYYLGHLYHLQENFEAAARAFQFCKSKTGRKNFLIEEIDFLIAKCKTAAELKESQVNVTIRNIGGTINSEYPDYVPVISADESVLIFTSRRAASTGGLLDPMGDYFEDVYISNKVDSVWAKPRNISENINTATHDACVGLSADGELLFLYRTSEDLLSGDLYFSVFDGLDWLVPTKLPSPINTKDFTEPSASLSADGNTLYFSSNRPGGFGKKDIYKIVKLPGGEWSKVVNLGPAINTFEDDDSPFIHPDGKTLYFSSKAHRNMGGYDIFKTTRSETGSWSEPENIGCPINTPDDDIYFVLSTNGKTGYFSSERPGGFGGTDIYLINFPDERMDLSVYKGLVMDNANKPLAARISLINPKTGKTDGIYSTNQLTGKFIMIVAPGIEYVMTIEAEGFNSFTGTARAELKQELHTIKLTNVGK